MACEPIFWQPGNRAGGFICTSRGRGPRRHPCAHCGAMTELLCDGPPRAPRKKSCDAAVCHGCAVSVRAVDRDFCQHCAALPAAADCLARGPSAVEVACRGARVDKHGLCLRHAVLFDDWLARHGGAEVYAQGVHRDNKRAAFRSWLRCLAPSAAAATLERYRAPVGG